VCSSDLGEDIKLFGTQHWDMFGFRCKRIFSINAGLCVLWIRFSSFQFGNRFGFGLCCLRV